MADDVGKGLSGDLTGQIKELLAKLNPGEAEDLKIVVDAIVKNNNGMAKDIDKFVYTAITTNEKRSADFKAIVNILEQWQDNDALKKFAEHLEEELKNHPAPPVEAAAKPNGEPPKAVGERTADGAATSEASKFEQNVAKEVEGGWKKVIGRNPIKAAGIPAAIAAASLMIPNKKEETAQPDGTSKTVEKWGPVKKALVAVGATAALAGAVAGRRWKNLGDAAKGASL